jgi:hypothetical protein
VGCNLWYSYRLLVLYLASLFSSRPWLDYYALLHYPLLC